MLNCIALDDEPLALEILQTFAEQVDFLDMKKTFTNPAEATRYLHNYPVDLLFLDIQMPDVNGIDFFKSLKRDDYMLIFSTAYSHYAIEGFNLNAIDYLLKPFTFERFRQAVQKAADYHQYMRGKQQESVFLYVRAEYSLLKIALQDIICIEGFDDYVKIHLSGQKKPVLTRMNLKSIAEKLPAAHFVRVHRSFIVPLSKIEQVRNKVIHLGAMEVPIGANYEQDFYAVFGR